MAIKNVLVRPSVQFGHSLCAAQDMQPGQIVLEEKPDFTVPPPVETRNLSLIDSIVCASQIPATDIDEQVNLLFPQQKEAFDKIAHEEDTNLSRFLCTHFDIRPRHSQAPTLFGYFQNGAYVNHSCQPNTIYRWDETGQCMRWIALTTIAEGEDIYVNYFPMYDWETVTERRAILRRLFPFDCGCHRCQYESKDPSAGAAAAKIRDVHRQLSAAVGASTISEKPLYVIRDEVSAADDYLDLLGQHLNLSHSIDPRVYRGVLSRNGEISKAAALREKAIRILGRCFDKDTEQYEAERDLCETQYKMTL